MVDITLTAGARAHGFLIERVTPMPELRATLVQAVHEDSGARLLHMHTQDDENLMAIGFRTPPPNSTGLPHILEHTVLCGSRKYPVKDPFVELLKTSLATFLNAMTYPDRTVYPCASMNRKDFYNAASVYLDAVFHPMITEMHFKQEGHHLGFQKKGDASSPLKISGIVYNEMKGVYSSLDGVMWRATEGLYPDNAYGFDSGGDPEVIPELTYEQFRNFHRTFYHPSNAFFFFYGDIPTRDHLAFLQEQELKNYGRLEIETGISLQPRWTSPRNVTVPYPAAAEDKAGEKSAFLMAWLTNPLTDPVETFALGILSQYLLGHDGSPLHKALMDSGLGGEVAMSGYVPYRSEAMFGVGMKETSPDRSQKIEALALQTLRDIAARGLEPDRLESCFHQFEIQLRAMPQNYPLSLMDRVYNAWMYGADPLLLLRAREHMEELKRRAGQNPRFFEEILEKRVLNNPHRLSAVFIPDAQLVSRQEHACADRLEKTRAELSPQALERIAREEADLEKMQQQPNSPEALATLPRLRLKDVPEAPQVLHVDEVPVVGRPLLRPDIFSNGLCHVQVAVDVRGLAPELVPYLPIYATAVTSMGAAGRTYAEMDERETSLTGGISASVGLPGHHSSPHRWGAYLYLSTTALDEKTDGMLDVLGERWFLADFTDRKRLKDLIIEAAIERREAASEAGHVMALQYAARHLSDNAALVEQFAGLTQARLARTWAEEFNREADRIVDSLGRIHQALRESSRIHAACLGSDKPFESVCARFSDWLRAMPVGDSATGGGAHHDASARLEGMAVPSSVAYVARAFHAVPASDPRAPALMTLANQLTYGYLWNEVRVKRGAYGCSARYDQGAGLFTLSSFRDPNIVETLGVYSRMADYVVKEMDLSDAAVEQYVIGAFKALDAPMRPARAISVALSRELTETRDADRALFRQRLLGVTGAALREAAEEMVRPALKTAPTAIVAGRELLDKARCDLPDLTIETF